MAQPRRTGTTEIEDPKQRAVTFLKRRQTLAKKALELSLSTNSRVIVFVQSSRGSTYYWSFPRGTEINPKNIRRERKANSPVRLSEWEEDWVDQQCDSCTTKEDFESLITRYEACVVHVRKRLEDWEENPSVKAGDFGIKLDCDPEVLPDQNFDSVLEGFEASIGSLLACCKDSVGHGGCDSFWPSPVNSAAGGPSNLTCSSLDGSEFNPDVFLNHSEDCIGDGDCPENSALGGGYGL